MHLHAGKVRYSGRYPVLVLSLEKCGLHVVSDRIRFRSEMALAMTVPVCCILASRLHGMPEPGRANHVAVTWQIVLICTHISGEEDSTFKVL
jgi:hypothetical protein